MLELKGHLGKEELKPAYDFITDLKSTKSQKCLLILNSTSGDLQNVLQIAREIYALKIINQLKIQVYIDEHAIGSAAVLPFLADELYTSLSASWGEITYHSETFPTNILSNRVQSLIDPQHSHANLMIALARAMSDPTQKIILNNDKWEIHEVALNNQEKIPTQTLILNQNQLKALNLISEILPLEQLKQKLEIEPVVPSSQPATLYPIDKISRETQEKLQQFIKWHKNEENQIGYLYVGDHETSISQATWLYIQQGLDYYKKTKPLFIILEIDTPGGEVFAAQKISDALKEIDTQYNIPVVAYINNWAISAGAMLAYACRFITVVKEGSMGAAEPVLAGADGKMESASEKINSALRADFASRATFFDRNPDIAAAMVDKDLIVVKRFGKIMTLDNENQIRYTGPDPDVIISPKGKLLTLNASQLLTYGVADLILPPTQRSSITEEEKKSGVWPAEKMQLFHAPFFSSIPEASIQAYQMDWKTRFFVLLATPLVSSLLLMGLIIGAYIEFQSPGLSLPGIVAGTSLFLIILSSFSLELGSWLELILLFTGLALILTEIFLLPTLGLLLGLGSLLFIIGLFSLLLPGLSTFSYEYETQTVNAAGDFVLQRLAWFCVAFILSGLIIALLARYFFPHFSRFNRFVLHGNEQDASRGYLANEAPENLPQPGSLGIVLATLRPAGKVIIADKIYDAITPGGFIEANEKIRVLRLEGSIIIVSRVQGELIK